MSFPEIMSLIPTPIATETETRQTSEQDASISSYAMSFFKGLGAWFQGNQDASLVRSQLNKIVKERDIVKKTDKSSKENTPATPGNYLTTLVGMESDVKVMRPKVLKDRSITNLFCKAKAKEINQILSTGETKIQITTAFKNDKTNEFKTMTTDAEGLPSIGEIIADDIAQLEARTTAQKAYDFVCHWFFGGSNAEKALSLHYENRAKLKEILRPQHENVMKSLKALAGKGLFTKQFQEELDLLKPGIQEFLKDGSPFQKKTRDVIFSLCNEILASESLSSNDQFDYHHKVLSTLFKRTSPGSSGASTPPLTESDSEEKIQEIPIDP